MKTLRRYDRVLVHDAAQRPIVQRQVGHEVDVVVSVLPGMGPVEDSIHQAAGPVFPQPYALCIGTIRHNKDLAFPVGACARHGVRLLVAGGSDSPEYVDELVALAASSDCVTIEPEFLSPQRFEALIAGAQAVIISYDNFAASSGVISRAVGLGRHLVVVDDPRLLGQAGGASTVFPFRRHDEQSLVRALGEAFARELPIMGTASVDPHWTSYAQELLGLGADRT